MSTQRGSAPEISLRAATRADIPAIVGLIEASSHEPWSSELVTQLIADPASWGCIALSGGAAPVGAALARAADGEAEILNLVVEPSRRRQGIGATLLAEIIRAARILNATALFLEVAIDNIAARNLYSGAGFTTVGRRADYYVHGSDIRIDALIMRLDLITSIPEK